MLRLQHLEGEVAILDLVAAEVLGVSARCEAQHDHRDEALLTRQGLGDRTIAHLLVQPPSHHARAAAVSRDSLSSVANFEPGRDARTDLGSGIAIAGSRLLEAGMRPDWPRKPVARSRQDSPAPWNFHASR